MVIDIKDISWSSYRNYSEKYWQIEYTITHMPTGKTIVTNREKGESYFDFRERVMKQIREKVYETGKND